MLSRRGGCSSQVNTPRAVIRDMRDVVELAGILTDKSINRMLRLKIVRVHLCTLHCIVTSIHARSHRDTQLSLIAEKVIIKSMMKRWFTIIDDAVPELRLAHRNRRI